MTRKFIVIYLSFLGLFFSCSNTLKKSEDVKTMITTHKIIKTYWQAANDRDWQTFETLLHPDMVYELPQTRERVRGSSAFTEFNATYPGDWKLEMVRLCADESQAVSQIIFKSGGEDQTGISFFKFKNGLIFRISEYWPVPYKPPKRQIKAIERY
jgi:hypothetical protein